jgi:hypothetical protein
LLINKDGKDVGGKLISRSIPLRQTSAQPPVKPYGVGQRLEELDVKVKFNRVNPGTRDKIFPNSSTAFSL